MKVLFAVVGLIALSSSKRTPTFQGDNIHYVEGDSRHIGIKAPVAEALLKSRNGANNEYWLFTRQNPTTAQVIVRGDVNSIKSSFYLGSRPLNVIVHGWNNNGHSMMNPLITTSFLAVLDSNVIVVDWSTVAGLPYEDAAAEVPDVGRHLANLLEWLINTSEGNWNNVHLVGISLGAHVVGYAGRAVGGRPARVTGLDPSGSGWDSSPDALSTNSGQYVEVIHTNGQALGIFNNIGHADFYPNGGKGQPGCANNDCSHERATELFASSILTNHFIGRQCPRIEEAELGICSGAAFPMGNALIPKRGTGIYALQTGSSWPY